MFKNLVHGTTRVVERTYWFPNTLGTYTTDWFETVCVREMYLEWDEGDGAWFECRFEDRDGNSDDDIRPRRGPFRHGRNTHPWSPKPNKPPTGQGSQIPPAPPI